MDALGTLESVVSICRAVIAFREKLKANRAQAQRLIERVHLIYSALAPLQAPTSKLTPGIAANLQALQRVLQEIQQFLQHYIGRTSWFKRAVHAGSDAGQFESYRQQLAELIPQMNLSVNASAFAVQTADREAEQRDQAMLEANRGAIVALNQMALYHFEQLDRQGSDLRTLLEQGLYGVRAAVDQAAAKIVAGQDRLGAALRLENRELKEAVSALHTQLVRDDKRLQGAMTGLRGDLSAIGAHQAQGFNIIQCQLQSLCRRFEGALHREAIERPRLDPKLEIPLDEVQLEAEPFAVGSFGHIFRGRYAGEDVAVKLLPEFGAEQAEEFYREVAIMSRLRSPRMAHFCGASVVEDRAAIVMTYYAGKGLNDYLEAHKVRLERDWSARGQLMRDVVRGLVYLHQHKVTHRDFKSANILVDTHGRAYVSDFGLANTQHMSMKTVETQSQAYAWMAPEYFQARTRLSAASDIYSLGVILLEIASLSEPLLVGERGLTPALNEERLAAIDPSWPEALPALIRSCLTFEAKGRPSAEEVLGRIEGIEWRPMTPTAEETYTGAQSLHQAKQLPEALAAYERAARKGSAGAMTTVGLFRLQGMGGKPMDKGEGKRWLERAVEQEHPRGLMVLIEVYGKGDGVSRDYRKAYELAERLQQAPGASEKMKQQAKQLYEKYRRRYEAEQEDPLKTVVP